MQYNLIYKQVSYDEFSTHYEGYNYEPGTYYYLLELFYECKIKLIGGYQTNHGLSIKNNFDEIYKTFSKIDKHFLNRAIKYYTSEPESWLELLKKKYTPYTLAGIDLKSTQGAIIYREQLKSIIMNCKNNLSENEVEVIISRGINAKSAEYMEAFHEATIFNDKKIGYEIRRRILYGVTTEKYFTDILELPGKNRLVKF